MLLVITTPDLEIRMLENAALYYDVKKFLFLFCIYEEYISESYKSGYMEDHRKRRGIEIIFFSRGDS